MNILNYLFIFPTIFEYTEHNEHWVNTENTYVCIEDYKDKIIPNVYCQVKKVCKGIYIIDGRPWKSWSSCFRVAK